MQRNLEWERLLAEYLRSRAAEPFAWGRNDCVFFAAGAIEAITGMALLPIDRGAYATETGAARKVIELGGVSLESLIEQVAEKFAMREVPVLFAQRGDLVMIQQERGQSAGIVDLNGTHAVAAGQDGAVQVELASCKRAWRVG